MSRDSGCVDFNGLIWFILAKLQISENGPKTLGFYLVGEGNDDDSPWSCKVDASMRILSYQEKIPDLVRRTGAHVYTQQQKDWGYKSFAAIEVR